MFANTVTDVCVIGTPHAGPGDAKSFIKTNPKVSIEWVSSFMPALHECLIMLTLFNYYPHTCKVLYTGKSIAGIALPL